MNKKIISALAALFSLWACSSVNLEPSDRYDRSFAFKNYRNAQLYLNYFYKEIYQFGQFGSCALGGSNGNMSDGLTDILKYGSIVAGAGDCNLIMTVEGRQSTSQNYFDAWTTSYGWTRRLNEFLDGLENNKGNFTEQQVAALKAEALFFRAWCGFVTMRSHASAKDNLGLIVCRDLSSMKADSKNKERSSMEESWNFIEEDLDFAIGHLPGPDASGRLHRYAALALKARAMLYAGRYDQSKEAVLALMEGPYDFEEDYDKLFTMTSKETIWAFEFQKGTLVHNFDSRYSQPGDVCEEGHYGGGLAGPTQEFVDMFDNADGTAFDASDASRRYVTPENVGTRDPRLGHWVLFNRAQWKGRALECFPGGADMRYMPYGSVNSPGNSVTGYYMRKLLDESNRNYLNDGSFQPWIEFRYSEMVLILAECLARENDFTGAREELAKLRNVRFGKEVTTAAVSNLEAALDLILKERATELCFEGHRFWDLRRTGRAASVLDGKKYTGVEWTKLSDGSFTASSISCDIAPRRYPERFDRFPLPQSEISNNTLAKQNSDW